MKDNIFKKLSSNVKNAFTFQDEDEYYDDEYLDEEEEEEVVTQEPAAPKPAPKTAPKAAPSYQSYGTQQSAYQAASYQPYGSQSDAAAGSKSKKGSGNIYNMNSAKPSQKLKVALFVLEDMDDDFALEAEVPAGPGKAFAQHVRHAAVGSRALEQQGAGGPGRLAGLGGAGRKQEGGEQEQGAGEDRAQGRKYGHGRPPWGFAGLKLQA